jgi:epoxide hydrolase-like protein
MGTFATTAAVRPFTVKFPDEALADLRRRIAATRLPTKELVDDRSQGVQLATIQALARYWTTAARPKSSNEPLAVQYSLGIIRDGTRSR